MAKSISILVPIYNSERVIQESARSIFAQSEADRCEFIFVDDGSSDCSLELLDRVIYEEFAHLKDQIRIVRHTQNQGVGAARNSALSAATGDFILFVDSDDRVSSDIVARLLAEQQRGDFDIVASAIYEVSGGRQRRRATRWFAGREGSLRALLAQSFHLTNRIWGLAIRREIITRNDISFEPRINFGEDMLFLTKLLYYSQRLAHIDTPLYHYHRDILGSYSNTSSRTNERSYIRALHSAWGFISQRDVDGQYRRAIAIGRLNLRRWLLIRRGGGGITGWIYRLYCIANSALLR